MKTENIIRAWKDEEYRSTLTDDELAAIPTNPAGPIELQSGVLREISGGGDIEPYATAMILTMGCCSGLTTNTCVCTVGCGISVDITCHVTCMMCLEY